MPYRKVIMLCAAIRLNASYSLGRIKSKVPANDLYSFKPEKNIIINASYPPPLTGDNVDCKTQIFNIVSVINSRTL